MAAKNCLFSATALMTMYQGLSQVPLDIVAGKRQTVLSCFPLVCLTSSTAALVNQGLKRSATYVAQLLLLCRSMDVPEAWHKRIPVVAAVADQVSPALRIRLFPADETVPTMPPCATSDRFCDDIHRDALFCISNK